MKHAIKTSLLLIALLYPEPTMAQIRFDDWLATTAQELIEKGIAPATLDRVKPFLIVDESVIELDLKQPEHKITFSDYLRNTLTASRMDNGQELLDTYRPLLSDIAARYNVPPQLIIALWGIESSFGDNQGDDHVLTSLVTLAYEGRRAEFFKKELYAALRIVEEGRDPDALRGSWAGAMGQCQFMPSTYQRFAIDFDGDGVKDIWDNQGDVFASIANYIAAEGWRGASWGREVLVTRAIPASMVGTKQPRTVQEWVKHGVRAHDGGALSFDQPQGYLIQPDGVGGRSFLVNDNFLALMKWNRSTYFATAIGLFMNRLQ